MKKTAVLLISFCAAVSFCGHAYADGYSVTLNDVELDYENGFISVSGNIGEMNSSLPIRAETRFISTRPQAPQRARLILI